VTEVLVTNMRNFPLRRGVVAGLLKGYVGLSAALFTQIFSGVLHHSPTSLLLLLAVGLPLVCLATMYYVRPCTPALGEEEDSMQDGHLAFAQLASVVLGAYLVGTTVLGNVVQLSDATSYALFGVTVLLLLAPLAIPVKMTLFRKTKEPAIVDADPTPVVVVEDEEEEPLLVPSSAADKKVHVLLAEGEGAVVKRKRRPRRGEDFEFTEALVKADFWLLWVGYFIGVGTGVTVLNNLAQIGAAAGIVDTTVLLSLFGLGNFLGRLGGCALTEKFVRSTLVVPRPMWMAATKVVHAGAYLCLAYALGPGTVYACAAVIGVCYGAQFAVMIPTTSELFGLKNFGLFYNLMSVANPLARRRALLRGARGAALRRRGGAAAAARVRRPRVLPRRVRRAGRVLRAGDGGEPHPVGKDMAGVPRDVPRRVLQAAQQRSAALTNPSIFFQYFC
jgi:hypothetical protein